MAVSTEVDHVILTRFNLPTVGFEQIVRAKEGWLKDRISLFERYCIPSVVAQNKQSFSWLIYFDSESPEWLKKKVQGHVDDKLYTPLFRTSVGEEDVLRDIREFTGDVNERLITSNLDNDDAVATNFVERVQDAAPRHGRSAIFLSRGLIRTNTNLYLRRDKENAFCSVISDWSSPSTCWSDWHTLLTKKMPSVHLYDEPAWLQVVHGLNVSNRVRGNLTGPSNYDYLFPGLIQDLPSPGGVELLSDYLRGRPIRFIRDSTRVLGKNVIINLLGKDSIDRVKIIAERLRR